jgi:hypothetical protein
MIILPAGSESKRKLITLGAGTLVLAVSALAARYFNNARIAQVGALLSMPAAAVTYTQIRVAPPADDFVTLRELQASYPLQQMADDFRRFGGQLEFVNWDEDTSSALIGSGRVYPVCEQGRNRSQLLYQHLETAIGDLAQPPHGAISGCDPFTQYTTEEGHPLRYNPPGTHAWAEAEIYGFQSLKSHDSATGKLERDAVGRIPRFGEQQLIVEQQLDPRVFTIRQELQTWTGASGKERSMIADAEPIYRTVAGIAARQEMRQWMDENYFAPIIQEGGTLIVFNKAAHVTLMRLMENAQRLGVDDLSKVRLVATEASDPIQDEHDQERAITAFRERLQTAFVSE